MSEPERKPNSGSIPIMVIQILLPMLLAIVSGYGAVKYTEGDTIRAIQALDRRVDENAKQIEYVRINSVTREEMRLFIDQARSDLTDIKSDIRAMRSERR